MDNDREFAKQAAIDHMRAAVITGLVIFAISLVQFLIAQFSDSNHQALAGFQDPLIWIDLLVIFFLVWGISKYSRVCAVLLFLFYLVNKIMTFSLYGSWLTVVIGLVFLLLLGRGILGTFQYHKLMREADANYRSVKKKWLWWLMTPVALVLGFFMLLGFLIQFEILPASYVKSKQDITTEDIKTLSKMGLIDPQENLLGLYSYGLFSIAEGGVLMTDSSLISYAEEADKVYIDRLDYDEIDWVKQLSAGTEFEPGVYQVSGKERFQGFQFMLSTENNGDTVFIQKLKAKINPPEPNKGIPMPDFEL